MINVLQTTMLTGAIQNSHSYLNTSKLNVTKRIITTCKPR